MKKILLLLAAMSVGALAQETGDKAEMCKTLKVSAPVLTIQLGRPNAFFATWKQPAKFPNPEKTHTIYVGTPIECEDFSVTLKSSGVTIKGKTYESLNRALSLITLGVNSGYKYPSIQEGFYYNSVWLDLLPSLKLSGLDKEGVISRLLAGYKVNGGEFRPLIFEGKEYPFEYKTGDVVEIFLKNSDYTILQYVKIDTKNNELLLEANHPFPLN